MLGKIEGRRRRGHQGMRWLDGITDAMDMNLGKPQKMMRDREAWLATVHGSQRVEHNWMTGQQQLKEGLTGKMNWEQEANYEIWEKNIPG